MPKENYRNCLLSLLIATFLVIACDGGSRIKGQVYDSEDKPIENATVKFEAIDKGELKESYQCIGRTAKDGKFDCGFLHSPFNIQLKLTVSKEGYKIHETEFSSREASKKLKSNEEYQIVLEKDE